MAQWECIVCGLIYDEKDGWPDDGIPPGTKWADVPDDWSCPDCGVGKEASNSFPAPITMQKHKTKARPARPRRPRTQSSLLGQDWPPTGLQTP